MVRIGIVLHAPVGAGGEVVLEDLHPAGLGVEAVLFAGIGIQVGGIRPETGTGRIEPAAYASPLGMIQTSETEIKQEEERRAVPFGNEIVHPGTGRAGQGGRRAPIVVRIAQIIARTEPQVLRRQRTVSFQNVFLEPVALEAP